jgi:hypothetical protein
MTQPPAVEWDAPEAELAEDDSGLGAAVLPEFADAAGIETLTESAPKRGRKPRVASEETPAPSLDRKIMLHALMQLDKTISLLLSVEPEDESYMGGVADTVLPLANHYAAKSESVVAMAIFAGLGLLSFAVVKYQRFKERVFHAQQKAA